MSITGVNPKKQDPTWLDLIGERAEPIAQPVGLLCDHCDKILREGDTIICGACQIVEQVVEKIIIEPEYGNCRRCTQTHYLNSDGWCSPDCEKGNPRP